MARIELKLDAFTMCHALRTDERQQRVLLSLHHHLNLNWLMPSLRCSTFPTLYSTSGS